MSGRALATFQASTSGGLALGAWAWGVGADHLGTAPILLIVGALMLASPLAAFWLRLPTTQERNEDSADELADPRLYNSDGGATVVMLSQKQNELQRERELLEAEWLQLYEAVASA